MAQERGEGKGPTVQTFTSRFLGAFLCLLCSQSCSQSQRICFSLAVLLLCSEVLFEPVGAGKPFTPLRGQGRQPGQHIPLVPFISWAELSAGADGAIPWCRQEERWYVGRAGEEGRDRVSLSTAVGAANSHWNCLPPFPIPIFFLMPPLYCATSINLQKSFICLSTHPSFPSSLPSNGNLGVQSQNQESPLI